MEVDKEKLRSTIYSKIDELPTLPIVVPRILSLMEKANADAGKITEAISHDPALTSKILKVANSAYYGFPQKITSLDRAVALLGFNMVKSLAISVGVIRSLPSKGLSKVFDIEGLWVHSLAVATAMKALARGAKEEDERETLFIVGLLHDLGKIILAEFFPDDFAEVLERSKSDPPVLLYESERRVIGMDHGEVGSMLLSRWKFPELIITPISKHHRHEENGSDYVVEKAALRVADSLVQEIGIGDGGNPFPPEMAKEDMEALAIDKEGVDRVRKELSESREGINGFFQAIQ
ncbi:MAG: HDOD domain-containing protein [Deltaproteobacteria bacterium]|nr:HDOD domain-containing protein [Deltaproteobacteria bacterium]MBW1928218.1 HDOD domain-containing protein [Deltaproteobacteria bacterium]MBW2124632.1 HDOD domain-containing protein [Deltaproteobacteria bacterium]RLB21036.1 MAG: hypothetical protein DRG76_09840 [Deltaproteobacteria bacterium]